MTANTSLEEQNKMELSKHNGRILDEERFLDETAFSLFKEDMKNYRVLSKEEQEEILHAIAAGDNSKRDELLLSNVPLVISRAKRIHSLLHSTWEIPDLAQEGFLGLMKALKLYDINNPERASFSTYAIYWIDNNIQRFLLNNGNSIRVPVHLLQKYQNTNKLLAKGVSKADALKETELSEEKYDKIYSCLSMVSLNKKIKNKKINYADSKDSEMEHQDTLADLNINLEEEYIQSETLKQIVDLFREKLSQRESEILIRRIGLDGHQPETLLSIAKSMNITRERVRQIQEKAEKKVRPAILKIYSQGGNS